MVKDLNVVLDLDNTLIFSLPFKKFPTKKTYLHKMVHHKMDEDYIVFERPGLQKFLDWLFENFNVMVWSAGSPEYVDFIVRNILEKNRKVEYVLNSDNCEDSQRIFGEKHIKNLKYLWDINDLPGYGPFNTLLIDDLMYNCKTNPYNSKKIKDFRISKKECLQDTELKSIKKFLSNLYRHFNKNIEKDGFRLVEF
jgi:hypothetical protein